jgi:hypothetical protein
MRSEQLCAAMRSLGYQALFAEHVVRLCRYISIFSRRSNLCEEIRRQRLLADHLSAIVKIEKRTQRLDPSARVINTGSMLDEWMLPAIKNTRLIVVWLIRQESHDNHTLSIQQWIRNHHP